MKYSSLAGSLTAGTSTTQSFKVTKAKIKHILFNADMHNEVSLSLVWANGQRPEQLIPTNSTSLYDSAVLQPVEIELQDTTLQITIANNSASDTNYAITFFGE